MQQNGYIEIISGNKHDSRPQ